MDMEAALDHSSTATAENRRQDSTERRNGTERRQRTREESGYSGPERRAAIDRRTGLERRRGAGLRLTDERRAAEEGDMHDDQFEFIMAIETYKKVNKRMYPTWTEILEIVQQLGYRKVMPRSIKMDNVPEPQITKL